jgi:excisionase family DNA binding protein
MQDYLTTNEAARILGLTDTRIRQLILSGKLPSKKFGRDHMINREDLSLIENRKNGRPSKEEMERKAA